MSLQLINHNADLKRLRDEGYDIEVRNGYLVVNHVPYVNSNKQVKVGRLVSALTLAGDVTTMGTHVAFFAGDHPCNKDGTEIAQIKHGSAKQVLDKDLEVHHSFSSKPPGGSYKDYHEKMTTYVAIVSSPAQAIDPKVTANTFTVMEAEGEESVFNYVDTASSRVGINLLTRKLALSKVCIIGLGGTGSYVLDLVAKTPVKEIHLFDGDTFSSHNAFRSPGAPSVEVLRKEPKKVEYFKEIYSKMHRNIIAHDCYLDASSTGQLQDMAFAFVCLDKGEPKKPIVEKLEEYQIPFVDVGMGIERVDDALLGILRVTASTVGKRDHVRAKNRISFTNAAANDEYSRNIQIADLNALNAALAVIKWKKLFGFYRDIEKEHFGAYTIDGNHLVNEDQA